MADVAEAFRVNATNDTGNGSFAVTWDQGTWDGFTWSYELDHSVDLGAGQIQDATIVVAFGDRSGQTVTLNFNVAAGGSNTVFDISSGLAGVGYASAMGRATAAVSVTDTTGNGATLSPDGASMYHAFYNGAPGTEFAGLLGGAVNAGAFSTATGEAEFPGGGGYAPIFGSVGDMSAQWTFAVSAFDLAAGTSVFNVIPAPGSVALLGLAGLAARRRR
jgi:hypothetical protein